MKNTIPVPSEIGFFSITCEIVDGLTDVLSRQQAWLGRQAVTDPTELASLLTQDSPVERLEIAHRRNEAIETIDLTADRLHWAKVINDDAYIKAVRAAERMPRRSRSKKLR